VGEVVSSSQRKRKARLDAGLFHVGVPLATSTYVLNNPADRDHSLQYMIAVPLLFGRLTANDYEDEIANDPRIDALREKMAVSENPQFTKDYFDPDKCYIGNRVPMNIVHVPLHVGFIANAVLAEPTLPVAVLAI